MGEPGAERCAGGDDIAQAFAEYLFGGLAGRKLRMPFLRDAHLVHQGFDDHRHQPQHGGLKQQKVAVDAVHLHVEADGNAVLYVFQVVARKAEDVVHGQNVERYVIALVVHFLEPHVADHGAGGEHNALVIAHGAAGKDDGGEVVGLRRFRVRLGGVEHAVDRVEERGVPHIDKSMDAGNGGADLLDALPLRGLVKKDLHVGFAQQQNDLIHVELGRHGHERLAAHKNGVHGGEVRIVRFADHRHVAAVRVQGIQVFLHGAAVFIQLAVAHVYDVFVFGITDRRFLFISLGGVFQQLTDRKYVVFPWDVFAHAPGLRFSKIRTAGKAGRIA